jgi:hypothetical protein
LDELQLQRVSYFTAYALVTTYKMKMHVRNVNKMRKIRRIKRVGGGEGEIK